MSLRNERPTAQDPIIKYAIEIGWTHLSAEEALTLRRGESGTLFYQTLRDRLVALNPGLVTVDSADAIVSRIETVRNDIEGNAEILAWLRGGRTIFADGEKRHRNVTLVDFEHPSNNVFHVTDEWRYTNGRHANRADLVFLVNGVPVALVETKPPRKPDAADEGLVQIRRYTRETPEMMTAPQVFNITNVLDFYYGATWNLDRKDISAWKDEDKDNFERKVKRFFGRERFLDLLGQWIIFYKRDDDLRKIVLRQHQTRAVEKIIERVLDPEKTRGLIWHTQGSGKTFTMIKAAQQILKHEAFEKPTVIMLVDRNELESQLFGNLNAYGLGYGVVTSKARLRELLRADYRGLLISMIHKFDRSDADLCTRANVFLLVDEAHRTTGGDLGNYLVAALPNATMIGFTGTPIDKIAYGKGTFKVFGKDDRSGYLDKYSIAESIEDGATVSLRYAMAPSEITVPQDVLDAEFLSLADAEGISDIDELNAILDRAVRLKTFLKAPERIGRVAEYVARHFKENVEPLGYKAFLVGVDREACALYKQAIDRHLPQDYSVVVYTPGHNDSEMLASYWLSEDAEKRVRKDFTRPGRLPKILIVTEKLLTGFDAPVLYCMYLDKPMRDHTLLQAIARVNRPLENENGIKKPSGLVLDFVGIFGNLEKALAFDSDVVASVIENIDILKHRFGVLMAEQAEQYLRLVRGPANDKMVERAVDHFADKQKRDDFYKLFRQLEDLYEIISPDPFLRDYLADYGGLATLYEIVRANFSRRGSLYGDVARKTEAIVREQVCTYGLDKMIQPVEINEHTIEALRRMRGPRPANVVNIARGVIRVTAEHGEREPYLLPIGDRAEAVLEEYDERQIGTEEAIRQLDALIREYLEAQKARESAGLDARTFTAFWILKQDGLEDPRSLAGSVSGAFNRFPDHLYNPGEARELKAELYRLLLPVVGRDRMVSLAKRLLEAYHK